MRIVITGASGNFGSGVVRGLLKKLPAKDLILVSRKPEKLAHLAQLGCEIRQGDFDRPEGLEEALRGADKMLLISGHKVGHRIVQHAAAIDAAKRAGVKHIVYTSYFGSDAGNTALVCIDHHGTEEHLKKSGVKWTILRDGMYADSMVNAAMPAALSSGRWVTCAGDGKVNLVDREDCIECAVIVLSWAGHENRLYNILGPDLWSFPEMAALASEVTGKPIVVSQVSEEEMYAFLDAAGIPRNALKEFNVGGFEWCSDDMISYERETRNGKFALLGDDVKRLTGHNPKSFRDFVAARVGSLKQAAGK
jgi:NAD(P)H dehydrogenase (quinone)